MVGIDCLDIGLRLPLSLLNVGLRQIRGKGDLVIGLTAVERVGKST